jgi:hypothetical protein
MIPTYNLNTTAGSTGPLVTPVQRYACAPEDERAWADAYLVAAQTAGQVLAKGRALVWPTSLTVPQLVPPRRDPDLRPTPIARALSEIPDEDRRKFCLSIYRSLGNKPAQPGDSDAQDTPAQPLLGDNYIEELLRNPRTKPVEGSKIPAHLERDVRSHLIPAQLQLLQKLPANVKQHYTEFISYSCARELAEIAHGLSSPALYVMQPSPVEGAKINEKSAIVVPSALYSACALAHEDAPESVKEYGRIGRLRHRSAHAKSVQALYSAMSRLFGARGADINLETATRYAVVGRATKDQDAYRSIELAMMTLRHYASDEHAAELDDIITRMAANARIINPRIETMAATGDPYAHTRHPIDTMLSHPEYTTVERNAVRVMRSLLIAAQEYREQVVTPLTTPRMTDNSILKDDRNEGFLFSYEGEQFEALERYMRQPHNAGYAAWAFDRNRELAMEVPVVKTAVDAANNLKERFHFGGGGHV